MIKISVGVKTGEGKAKGVRLLLILAVALSLVGICREAGAFEIDTGNENVRLSWDNTFRYNLAYRVKDQNKAIISNPNNDDGDRNFNKGIVSNRLDLLSGLDLVYKGDHGIRVSGAGWYDQRYKDHLDNTSLATSNTLKNGRPTNDLNDFVDRYYAGPNGELLDAFVFGKLNIGPVPVNVKVGRHSVMWGESLLLGGYVHSVAYAQTAVDLGKGQAQPGVEAKELFRPLNSISLNAQVTERLSIAAQYYLQWERNLLPEGGTYLGTTDALLGGGNSFIAGFHPLLGFIRFPHGNDIEPDQNGDWGVSARWNPRWLDGSLGLYYRNFSDKIPQLFIMPSGPTAGTWQGAYASGIRLYGISLSKQVAGVSVGLEFSYRQGMPLVSDPVTILPGSPLPIRGTPPGAIGNTLHGLVNFIGIISPTPVFDTASWNLEFSWNNWVDVTKGNQYFKGRDSYSAIDRVSKDFVGVGAGFTPTWYQVLAGVDLSMPLSISTGLIGNSAVAFGGNKNAGSYSVGIGADIFTKYKVDLKYIDFFGDYDTNPMTGAVTVANGGSALLKDRGMITLTLKVTF